MWLLMQIKVENIPFYAYYHSLSAYLSFHAILSDNIKIYYFRDNYAFSNNIF